MFIFVTDNYNELLFEATTNFEKVNTLTNLKKCG